MSYRRVFDWICLGLLAINSVALQAQEHKATREAILPPLLPWKGRSEALVVAATDPWITPVEQSNFERMWPVNGKFNQWQRELYDFYLACYQAILQAIRPGVTAAQIKQEAVKVMESTLAQSTFSKPHYQTAAKNFVDSYRTGAQNAETYMGHWVGMATHDVGVYTGPLKAGMVFTIEPGLRVPEEKINIRLEDLIVITETGKEIISEFVPMDRAGIEKLMAEKGLLETYPAGQ